MSKIRNLVAKHDHNRGGPHKDKRREQVPDFEVDFDEDVVTCPACGHSDYQSEFFLGILGNLIYYRCSFCGWDFTE